MTADRSSAVRAGGVALLTARVVLGGVFLLAGVDKVQAPGAFADAVRTYHLLPPSLVLPFAFVVPWIEVLVAVYLLLGYLIRVAATGALVMLAMFIFALGKSLATGDTNHACGCFGSTAGANSILAFVSGGSTITWWDLVRDIILAALALVLLLAGSGAASLDRVLRNRRHTAERDRTGLSTKERKYRAKTPYRPARGVHRVEPDMPSRRSATVHNVGEVDE